MATAVVGLYSILIVQKNIFSDLAAKFTYQIVLSTSELIGVWGFGGSLGYPLLFGVPYCMYIPS